MNKAKWPAQKQAIAAMFRTRTRDEWAALLGNDDTCVAPVLNFDEAPLHPHNVARDTFISVDSVTQPAPAPRFSRTPSAVPHSASVSGDDTELLLLNWGLPESIVRRLAHMEMDG
jgi:alpha-methylacyl-CoA racemase